MKKNVGKLKYHARSRNWEFTVFVTELTLPVSALQESEELLQQWFTDTVCIVSKKACCQFEKCPKTGRFHMQGTIEFANETSLNVIKRKLDDQERGISGHYEVRGGTRALSVAYCTKEESRIAGPWFHPSANALEEVQGHRNDLDIAVETLHESGFRELLTRHATTYVKYPRGFSDLRSFYERTDRQIQRDISVHVLWGDPGTGKTKYVYDLCSPDLYRLCFDDSKRCWFDGYEGESNLLLDDFYGQIPFAFLLNILDRYPLRVPIKCAFTWANWDTVYITSNVPWEDWYKQILLQRPVLHMALRRRITKVHHFAKLINT